MTRKSLSVTLILLVFALLTTVPASAELGSGERVKFGRYPAPSPDGHSLAFSWAGDIWTVPINGGVATRLSGSDGYDWYPVWSPDGDKIAFMSDRYGSEDLFVIDSDGGTAERITFASNGDLLSGWLPDGSGLIFSSRRGGTWPNHREPLSVNFEADYGEGPGMPEVLVPSPGLQAVMNPDRNQIAFHFGAGNRYREGYRGTHKEDIWIYEKLTGNFTQVTNNDVSNTDPMWSADGSNLYYRSEESGVGNIWVIKPLGEKSQVTHYTDTGLWHPKIGGPAGSEIVAYEYRDGIFIHDLLNNQTREVRVTAWLDEDPDTPSVYSTTGSATEYSISPDGKEVAFVVRGEIFCVRSDGVGGTVAARLTDSPARDWQIQWYPRGDSILFVSDRDGIENFYRIVSDDPEHERLSEARRFKVERLFRSDQPCMRPVMAPVHPDHEGAPPAPEDVMFAYVSGFGGDLWLMDGNGDNRRRLYANWDTGDYSFSPDGRWIAYSRQDVFYNVDIFIAAVDPDDETLPECPSEGWQPFPGNDATGLLPNWADGEINITRHPDDDWMPVWSPDGSKLGFTGVRYGDNVDSYWLYLTIQDDERTREEWELDEDPLPPLPEPEEDEDVEDVENVEEETDDEDAEAEEVDEVDEEDTFAVEIDFENIHRRARRLTTGIGTETTWEFSPDGDYILYSSSLNGVNELMKVKWTGEETKKIVSASVDYVKWLSETDRIYYLSGGRISSYKSNGSDSQSHSFNASVNIDPLQYRLYKFEEAWRLEDRQFYDPDFHGQNWDALHDEYEPLVRAARHYRDFNDAMNMLLGRLNASHLSYRDAERGPSAPETGYLGCKFNMDNENGLVISDVTENSPVDEIEISLVPGDRLVSINGFNVGGWDGNGDEPLANYWRALDATANSEIEIGVIREDSETGEIEWMRLRPSNYWTWYGFAYEQWLKNNRRVVSDLSNGRFGYLHISRMYEGELERFEHDIFSAGNGKDGLIIDVRWNSGGWVADLLLSILNTRRHAYTQPPRGGLGYPEDRTPYYTTDVPIAVLINEWSYSNAEVFSHAILNLERGILVGWPTGGGVISTGGTRLSDGSYLSLPRRGWWAINPETKEILYNLEGTSADPDVWVNMLPPDFAAGTDHQLEESVTALLDQLAE